MRNVRKKSNRKQPDKARACNEPLGHRFEVSGIFWQNVAGLVHLDGHCVNCGGQFVVPVVRDTDREVVMKTARVRVSKLVTNLQKK